MEKELKEILEPLDLSESSDEEVGDEETAVTKAKQHSRLVKDISKLSGEKKSSFKKNVRSELSKNVSEFTWASGKAEKVDLHDLVNTISGDTGPSIDLRKDLEKLDTEGKALDVTLPKPQREKIERAVAYEENRKDISKWEPTVINNRKADHLSFPLQSYKIQRPSIRGMTARKMVAGTKTALEEEIEAVLKGSSYVLERKKKELTAAEEEALKAVDVQEALERRKELQRLRVLQTFYEAKCKRTKKIKSKKYHRIRKKEERRKQEKTDLEDLAKSDPTLFQSELEKAEKLRALERASLRHKNASKWARNLITKGHMTTKDKQAINEQLRISRQMTEQKQNLSDSEEGDDDNDEPSVEDANGLQLLTLQGVCGENPWLLGEVEQEKHEKEEGVGHLRLKKLKPVESKELEEGDVDSEDEKVNSDDEWDEAGKDASSKQNFTSTKMTDSISERIPQNCIEATVVEKEISLNEVPQDVVKTFPSKQTEKENTGIEQSKSQGNEELSQAKVNTKKDRPSVKPILPRKSTKGQKKKSLRRKKNHKIKSEVSTGKLESSSRIARPDQFLKVEKNAIALPSVSGDEQDSKDDDTRQMSIKEAFASDDVIAEFAVEKKELIKKAMPKDVDLTLPGWGLWGGSGVKIPKKKRRKFIRKAKPPPKRKDAKLPLVIINEDKSEKFMKNQVSDVPFPYGSKELFEKSIRQPLGPNWNTPSVTAKLIQPRITKETGTMIDPIKPSKQLKRRKIEELKEDDSSQRQQKGKKKRKKK